MMAVSARFLPSVPSGRNDRGGRSVLAEGGRCLQGTAGVDGGGRSVPAGDGRNDTIDRFSNRVSGSRGAGEQVKKE